MFPLFPFRLRARERERRCFRARESSSIEDERRAAEAKRRVARALNDAIFESGLNTFATKKYGGDWRESGYDDVAQDYAEWMEEREY